MGGYDATVGGVDPSIPIQFFTLPGNACPYAQRTHIVFNELQVPVDIMEVSGIPKPDWFLKINPKGKVPTIRVPTTFDQEVITESAVCNEFLCDYSATVLGNESDLMPSSPIARAWARLLNDHCDAVFAKTQFTFLMNKDEDKDKNMADDMERALSVYENSLERHGGPFLLGESFTLADVHIYPFILRLIVTLRHWKNYELPNDKFPRVLDWFRACSQRKSVQDATLSEEKIIEIYTKFFEVDYSFGGLNQNKN
eukprot:CAMPEP_0196817194 /NCGR_PEP_ID=MMETSP1362-20130617/59319_1 /TAXON_ID=163516 /ORGANISM="Leptocylindrus danicus, Strain CCMP1856" /LENGTH=253 /DNA_ID=CAMNT_0042194797 /DNA_START=175 /DNA_END=936 /DNA_ORIENTATION=-